MPPDDWPVSHPAPALARTPCPIGHPKFAPAQGAMESAIGLGPSSRGFAALLTSYQNSGGMACGEDVLRQREARGWGNFVDFARLISSGELLSLAWRATHWIPMFQFDPQALSVQPGTRRVLAELDGPFDDWTRVAWFAEPNGWLQGRRPADMMGRDLAKVLNAARADRFIAEG